MIEMMAGELGFGWNLVETNPFDMLRRTVVLVFLQNEWNMGNEEVKIDLPLLKEFWAENLWIDSSFWDPEKSRDILWNSRFSKHFRDCEDGPAFMDTFYDTGPAKDQEEDGGLALMPCIRFKMKEMK